MSPHDDPTDTPCPFSLLAATFALMTRYADPVPGARVSEAKMRRLLARKIVSNLFFLQHHPQLPAGFGQVVAQVHAQWQSLAGTSVPHCPQQHAALH